MTNAYYNQDFLEPRRHAFCAGVIDYLVVRVRQELELMLWRDSHVFFVFFVFCWCVRVCHVSLVLCGSEPL